MPSAEHAPMPPTGPPGSGTASVIHLAHRRKPPAPTPPAPEPATSPAFEVALSIQARYLARGDSLANPATARAYDIALETVQLLIDGAGGQGVVDEAQQQTLRALVEDMRKAPRIITG